MSLCFEKTCIFRILAVYKFQACLTMVPNGIKHGHASEFSFIGFYDENDGVNPDVSESELQSRIAQMVALMPIQLQELLGRIGVKGFPESDADALEPAYVEALRKDAADEHIRNIIIMPPSQKVSQVANVSAFAMGDDTLGMPGRSKKSVVLAVPASEESQQSNLQDAVRVATEPRFRGKMLALLNKVIRPLPGLSVVKGSLQSRYNAAGSIDRNSGVIAVSSNGTARPELYPMGESPNGHPFRMDRVSHVLAKGNETDTQRLFDVTGFDHDRTIGVVLSCDPSFTSSVNGLGGSSLISYLEVQKRPSIVVNADAGSMVGSRIDLPFVQDGRPYHMEANEAGVLLGHAMAEARLHNTTDRTLEDFMAEVRAFLQSHFRKLEKTSV